MLLGKTFDLKAYTHSDTAKREKIDNAEMTDGQLVSLRKLHALFSEISARLSTKFNKQILISLNSAFRSKKLNDYFVKTIGASKTSQHMDGQAGDSTAIGISLEEYYQALRLLAKTGILVFGQVIIEYGKHPEKESDDWLHVSLPKPGIVNDFRRAPIKKEDGAAIDGKRVYIKDPL